MGVKFTRKYEDIIKDMSEAIKGIDEFYSFFEIKKEDWESIEDDNREECIRTMADDIFYALGGEPFLNIEHGVFKYDCNNHIIKIYNLDKCIYIVNLI